MREYFVFDDPDVKRVLKAYVLKRGGVVEDLGDFIVRKVGRVKRLEYALQDLVDWWDSDLDTDGLKALLRRRYYRVVFKNLLEFSRFTGVLEGVGVRWAVKEGRVYYVPLSEYGSEEDFKRSLSRNTRKGIRRVRNGIERLYGKVRITEGDPVGMYGWTVERIRERHPEGPFSDPDFVGVQREVISILKGKGRLKVWVLKGGDEVLATSYVIESGGRAFAYLLGYRRERLGSFVRLLDYEVINAYRDMGFLEFNFMKGENPYKREWTDRYHRLYRYEALNPSLLLRILSLL